MPSLLLYLVVSLFAWMGFALVGSSGNTTLAPGFLIMMACLSVVVWDRVVAPMMRRMEARRAPKHAPAAFQQAASAPATMAAPRRMVQTARRPATAAWQPLPA